MALCCGLIEYGDDVATVRLDRITKVFGEGDGAVTAVDDVTLDILDHEFMVLLGPSGCGKSTLLRIVAGLERDFTGDAELDGRPIEEPGRDRIVRAAHELLGLIVFFTVGEEENRSWSIPRGATAQQAAGAIHSDIVIFSGTDVASPAVGNSLKKSGPFPSTGACY